MKKHSIVVLVAIAISTLFLSCKRERIFNNNSQITNKLNPNAQKVKNWFTLKTTKTTKTLNTAERAGTIIPGVDFRTGIPLWELTKHYPDQNMYITPLYLDIKEISNNVGMYKYLITKEDLEGDIVNGNFMYILVDNLKSTPEFKQMLPTELPLAIYNLENISAGFFGSVIKYDLSYKETASKNFYNGEITSGHPILEYKYNGVSYSLVNGADKFAAPVIPNPKEPKLLYCVEYYWIIESIPVGGEIGSGTIQSQEWTGEQCFYTSGAPGEMGNVEPESGIYEQPTDPNACSGVLSQSGFSASVSQQLISTETNYIDAATRTKKYQWDALSSATWKVRSIEYGQQVKIGNDPNPIYNWKFESLDHQSSFMLGTFISTTVSSGNVTAEETDHHSSVSNTGATAIMYLGIKTTATATCSGQTITKVNQYPCERTFLVFE